jgi:hypothetical protein
MTVGNGESPTMVKQEMPKSLPDAGPLLKDCIDTCGPVIVGVSSTGPRNHGPVLTESTTISSLIHNKQS